jgi:hypothetical protein
MDNYLIPNKMKSKILITALLALCGSSIDAQSISGGITGGVSTGSVKISDMGNGFNGVIQGDNIFGIEGGFFAKINLLPVYVKPEVLVLYKKGTVDVVSSSPESEGTIVKQSDFKMNKLEVPVLFGIRVLGPLNVEAGPVYNYILEATNKFNGYDVDVSKDGLGYRLGINIELCKIFSLGVSYQGITNKAFSKATFESPDEIIFGAALVLGSGKGIAPYAK